MGNGCPLPFSLWVLTSVLCKALLSSSPVTCPLMTLCPGPGPVVAEEQVTRDWECASVQQVQPSLFFSILLLLGKKKNIRKQLETQSGCFV